MRYLSFLMISILFISCDTNKIEVGMFDEVIHYKIDTLRVNVDKLLTKTDKTSNELQLDSLITGTKIVGLSDTILLDELYQQYLIKEKLPKSYFVKIKNSLVSSENRKNNSKCLPIYRDFLILKNKNKTITVVKICFDCEIVSFINDKITTEMLLSKNNNNSLFKKLK